MMRVRDVIASGDYDRQHGCDRIDLLEKLYATDRFQASMERAGDKWPKSLIDLWGNRFVLVKSSENRLVLISNGPNCVYDHGSVDDISIELE
jgi:hypothetical protein